MSKVALVVVDMQVGVIAQAWERDAVLDRVQRAVSAARKAQRLVVWVQHQGEELPADSAVWQWAAPLEPAPGEWRVHKQFNSSFAQTDLEVRLREAGVTEVVLAGACTNWCIRASAYAALERGFDLCLLRDAHTTESMDLGHRQVQAADIVADLNVAMQWLSYPGRRNRAISVDAFAAECGVV